MNLRREEKGNFIRKKVLISKGEKNTKETIIRSQALKSEVFLESCSLSFRKKMAISFRYVEKYEHYTNECKNKRSNKPIDMVGSLDCVELSEEEALDLS